MSLPKVMGAFVRTAGTKLNSRIIPQLHKPGPANQLNRDWDTMIILDSCRYDIFKQVNWFDGSLKKIEAPGSHSVEFINRVFGTNSYLDTVYIGGNPYMRELSPSQFHKLLPLLNDEWDEDLGVIKPERITNEAIEVHRQYPNKRIIVHYMQPHHPFLDNQNNTILDEMINIGNMYHPHIYSDAQVESGYKSNLRVVLEDVDRLMNNITGKIVITSDHGELLGERQWPCPIKGYDHHRGLYLNELIEVPWFSTTVQERRHIKPGSQDDKNRVTPQMVEKRLEDLGYK